MSFSKDFKLNFLFCILSKVKVCVTIVCKIASARENTCVAIFSYKLGKCMFENVKGIRNKVQIFVSNPYICSSNKISSGKTVLWDQKGLKELNKIVS